MTKRKYCAASIYLGEDSYRCDMTVDHEGAHASGDCWAGDDVRNLRITWEDNPEYSAPKPSRELLREIAPMLSLALTRFDKRLLERFERDKVYVR